MMQMSTLDQGEIAVTLRLSGQAHAMRAERAAALGQGVEQYITTIVESVLRVSRTLEEISGPIHQRFLESGTSEEELSDELEQAKHEMRAEHRKRHAS